MNDPIEPVIAIERACLHSRYFRQLFDHKLGYAADILAQLHQPWTAAAMQMYLEEADTSDPAGLNHAMRALRQRVIGQLMVRDLAGMATLQEVMLGCTLLADITLTTALAHHTRWLAAVHGQPYDVEGQPIVLAIVAMGKLGGAELNVSSDVDLVYLYAEEGETSGEKRVSHHQFFVSLAQRVGRSIAEATADGFVFRVDTRLRPWGESGPMAIGYTAFEHYLMAHGREWERYAWIKARPITGSRLQELSAIIRPFVYRKYLDFGAIDAMRALHAQIRREVIRRDRSDNIKLGPGGIREIEFIVQVFQLIRGGQDPALRTRSTLDMLPRLSERQLLKAHTVQALQQAYVFLRNLEHRLQYLDDAQTQSLPVRSEDKARVVTSMDYVDEHSFMHALNAHRSHVSNCFNEIFAAQNGQNEVHPLAAVWLGLLEDDDARQQLGSLGYSDGIVVYQRLQQIRRGQRYASLPVNNRERYDRLVPALINVAASTQSPDATLSRIMDLLDSIAKRAAYMALLQEYPSSLRRVADVCAASPWAASYLTQHPLLLDELIDDRLLNEQPDWPALQQELSTMLDTVADDVELQMNLVRHFRHRQVFHCLAQDLAGTLALPTLAAQLTRLAQVILHVVLPVAWNRVPMPHRAQPLFAIIGYGKLGSGEMGYLSDLDMVFLYQDDAPNAAELYARLVQRMISWLTTTTSAGILYDTDLRLRPDGASGLLVSSVAAFTEYQQQHAWVWEHQALTRARFVAGDEVIGRQFEQIRCQVLRQSRNNAQLQQDIIAMRRKISVGHPNRSELFDLKYDAGGMIDVEFCVQYLVLAYSHLYTQLTDHMGCVELLHRAAELALIDSDVAIEAGRAWQYYWQLQHTLRIQGMEHPRVTHETVVTQQTSVQRLWASLIDV